MILDDVLFGVIIVGLGLCAAHFRGEYLRWREETRMRMRHINGLSSPEDADSI